MTRGVGTDMETLIREVLWKTSGLPMSPHNRVAISSFDGPRSDLVEIPKRTTKGPTLTSRSPFVTPQTEGQPLNWDTLSRPSKVTDHHKKPGLTLSQPPWGS